MKVLGSVKDFFIRLLLYFLFVVNLLFVFGFVLIQLSICVFLILLNKLFKNDKLDRYIFNKATAMDQWGNVEFLGNPDETISSRLGRAYGKEKHLFVIILRWCVDLVADKVFSDKDHCRGAVEKYQVLRFDNENYELWKWEKREKLG